MKVECKNNRIYVIPENPQDSADLDKAVPDLTRVFCFYTMDAGKEGNEFALVITHVD